MNDNSVDYDFDGMLVVLDEIDLVLIEPMHLAVNSHPRITVSYDSRQHRLMLAFAPSDYRSKNRKPRSLSMFSQRVHNIVDGLARNLSSADWAMRNAYSRIQKSQIVVDLCYGSDG